MVWKEIDANLIVVAFKTIDSIVVDWGFSNANRMVRGRVKSLLLIRPLVGTGLPETAPNNRRSQLTFYHQFDPRGFIPVALVNLEIKNHIGMTNDT